MRKMLTLFLTLLIMCTASSCDIAFDDINAVEAGTRYSESSESGGSQNTSESSDTAETISEKNISETDLSQRKTENTPQTSDTELAETTTAVETELTETNEETASKASETKLTDTAKQETASILQTNVKTENAAPPETTSAKNETTTVTKTTVEKLSVEKDGSYTTPEDVAEYIHTFGTLPNNFITKDEAKALGWDSKKGNLWEVAEGKSIGGDYFGNYEGLLPDKKGRKYTECDVNYEGGYRGSERIIFSNDGLIYYTNDHYQTFTQLY